MIWMRLATMWQDAVRRDAAAGDRDPLTLGSRRRLLVEGSIPCSVSPFLTVPRPRDASGCGLADAAEENLSVRVLASWFCGAVRGVGCCVAGMTRIAMHGNVVSPLLPA